MCKWVQQKKRVDYGAKNEPHASARPKILNVKCDRCAVVTLNLWNRDVEGIIR